MGDEESLDAAASSIAAKLATLSLPTDLGAAGLSAGSTITSQVQAIESDVRLYIPMLVVNVVAHNPQTAGAWLLANGFTSGFSRHDMDDVVWSLDDTSAASGKAEARLSATVDAQVKVMDYAAALGSETQALAEVEEVELTLTYPRTKRSSDMLMRDRIEAYMETKPQVRFTAEIRAQYNLSV